MQRLDLNGDLTPGDDPAPGDYAADDLVSAGDDGDVTFAPSDQVAKWREQLAAVGGRSSLLHFDDAPRTHIELSTTHPGGLPQFITGHATQLSSLIRDDLALRNAQLAAAEITQRGIDLRSVRGIESVHLAIGLASWRRGDEEFLAPVLLRPLAIRRYGRDFELKLKGQPFLNPALARELHAQFGIRLNAESFVALALTNGVFKPQPVIDHLRQITAHLPWFRVAPRLVASAFAEVGPAMAADAAGASHPLIDALTERGTTAVIRPLGAKPTSPDERPPATDTLLLDADPEQEHVVAEIQAGTSFVVHTLPGTGGTQTIVNAIGALVADDRRVLVVGARRGSLNGIAHRLDRAGLPGMAVTTASLKRDLIQSIGRNEKAQSPRVADIDEALLRLRKVLVAYRGALTKPDGALGVSVLEALSALADLTRGANPPETTARLRYDSLVALAHDRSAAARTMTRAATLGEFRYGPGDSPWYGANFASTIEANAAHALALRLAELDLPRLLERGRDLFAQTRLRPFESIAELGVFLRLLLDVRDTLDKFVPAVYDRPLGELIEATGPRREGTMSSQNRRRLKKHALDFVRPGVHVSDLHGSLRAIQSQRTLWQRYADTGATPAVPGGIDNVHVAYQRFIADLAELDAPLGIAGTPRQLAARPIRDLAVTLAGLAEESEVLHNLQERTGVLQSLRELGLDPLLVDLSNRHVTEDRVAAELELAWWQSALEHLLATDQALLGANTGVLDRLESDFRLVDESHAASSGLQLAWRQAEKWRVALVDAADEAVRLKRLLRSDNVRPELVHHDAPTLLRTLAPVWLASPYEVAQIDPSITFDTVILVDAAATTLAENLGAIRRGRQVVAFGDPVTQTPSAFTIRVTRSPEASEATEASDLSNESAFARLSSILPTMTLTQSYRAGGEDLAELVNQRFYDGQIVSLPWAGSFLGHGSIALHSISGHGLPDLESGSVESVDAEVSKVVELVMDHAVKRPRETLMVITASAKHAARVHQAVLAAFTKRTDLSDFILRDQAEPFTVLTLEQAVAQSRDRVIFSIGYARTPHGRLLSNFGPLGLPGGDRLLAVAMTRARRSVDIVSAFGADDIDAERQAQGVVALGEILREAQRRQSEPAADASASPMLIDLAARLRRRGIRVTVGYGGSLALAAAYAGKAAVVETDATFGDRSLRESLRLRPDVLRRLGWHYVRVHSFDLFGNPEAVAVRVARVLGKPDDTDAPGRAAPVA
ncbi:MAG TPA: AAA family ATPase [Candidatus Lumbricidophila sp.]|nr:AAA family ATPase [Candidatus Lumbricidophila sp.]